MCKCRFLPLIIVAGVAALALALSDGSLTTASAASVTATEKGEFPDSYYYLDRRNGNKRYARPMSLEGKKAPKLDLTSWIGDEQKLDDLEGKIVVLDFWATWCPPCRAALPKNVKLYDKYKDKDVMIIGVHDAKKGSDSMAAMARAQKLNYPLAVDVLGTNKRGKSEAAWKVSFWPTYCVVDHKGIVRAAGLLPHKVEDVVRHLIKERDGNSAN